MLERCVDVGRQKRETRILIFALSPQAVADAIEEELEYESEHDARLAGCSRRTLQLDIVRCWTSNGASSEVRP